MTALYVSHRFAPHLTPREIATITKSIQQFQLGEGSRGERLLQRGKIYARAADDPLFIDTLSLFIQEEQQHSGYLEAFMQSQGIPVVSRHWVDTVFRGLRGVAGLELSLTVLVTAEFIAVPYYRALQRATNSPVLKMICRRILEDEAAHLRFQSSILGRVSFGRNRLLQKLVSGLHWLFLFGTMFVVWIEHQLFFEAAGYNFRRFIEETVCEFIAWDRARRALTMKHQVVRADGSAPAAVGR